MTESSKSPLQQMQLNALIHAADDLNYNQLYNLTDIAYGIKVGTVHLSPFRQNYIGKEGYLLVLNLDPRLVFLRTDGDPRPWVRFVLGLAAILAVLALLAMVIVMPMIISSSRSANIYNGLHGTSYTTSDFFWAEHQINASTSTMKLDGRLP